MSKIPNFEKFDVNEAIVAAGFGMNNIQNFGLGGGTPQTGYSMGAIAGTVSQSADMIGSQAHDYEMNENDEHTAKGYINEAKKHVNESIDKAYESCKAMDESARPSPKDILNAISTAKKGAIASGGGYGNWTKLSDNSWKNTKTNKLSHDKGLFDRIGAYYDFIIESEVNENDAKTIVKAFMKAYDKRDEVAADDWEQFIYDWTVMGDGGNELRDEEIGWDTMDDVLTTLNKKGYKKLDDEGIIGLYENKSITEAMVQVAGKKKPSGAKVLATVIVEYLDGGPKGDLETYFKSGFKKHKKDIIDEAQELIINSTF